MKPSFNKAYKSVTTEIAESTTVSQIVSKKGYSANTTFSIKAVNTHSQEFNYTFPSKDSWIWQIKASAN